MLNTCIFYCIYIQRKGKTPIFSFKKNIFFLNLYITANIALGRGNGNTQNDSKDDCLHLWDTFQQERYIMLMHLEAI